MKLYQTLLSQFLNQDEFNVTTFTGFTNEGCVTNGEFSSKWRLEPAYQADKNLGPVLTIGDRRWHVKNVESILRNVGDYFSAFKAANEKREYLLLNFFADADKDLRVYLVPSDDPIYDVIKKSETLMCDDSEKIKVTAQSKRYKNLYKIMQWVNSNKDVRYPVLNIKINSVYLAGFF